MIYKCTSCGALAFFVGKNLAKTCDCDMGFTADISATAKGLSSVNKEIEVEPCQDLPILET